MELVWVNGTFDIIHFGHICLLEYASSFGKLKIGIDSDNRVSKLKGSNRPFNNEKTRKKILESLKFVDEVFFEESFEKKREYIKQNNADIFVMGNDWEGRFDEFNDVCKVVYFDRTPSISTTELIEKIKN